MTLVSLTHFPNGRRQVGRAAKFATNLPTGPMTVVWIWLLAALSAPARSAEFTIDGRTFRLPDGYSIRQVAAPPLIQRPISASFDEWGRLYVTESSGSNDPVEKQRQERPHRIVRLEDRDGDGIFDRRIVFAEGIMFPEGALWHQGSLYVAAPPQIWKFTDTDGDGKADQRSIWFDGQTLTHCANDLHGPYLAPDGWIYWCKGAFAKQEYRRGDQVWTTRAAHLFRRRLEGGEVEPVMTGGMDNPVEVVFTRTGEPILTSTFIQHPRNGKRDGLIHAIYGGLFGKRHSVLKGHPRTGDLLPPLVHLGAAAPSGLARVPNTTPGATETLLATSFNMHKVTRHELTRAGASFQVTTTPFLTCDDVDFHPTDILVDADGSLLVLDTGGWYKLCCPTSHLWKPDILGGIYRITRDGAPVIADPRGHKLAWRHVPVEELLRRLNDPRPAVRHRAANQLVAQSKRSDEWLHDSFATRPPAVRLQLVWILTRIGGDNAVTCLRSLLEDDEPEIVAAALKGLSLLRDRGCLEAARRLLQHPDGAVRRNAAELCGRTADRSAIPDLLAALTRTPDRWEQHALTYALIEIADIPALKRSLTHQSASVRASAAWALQSVAPDQLQAETVLPWLTSETPLLQQTAQLLTAQRQDWETPLADWLQRQLAGGGSVSSSLLAVVQHFGQSEHVQRVVLAAAASDTLAASARAALIRGLGKSGRHPIPQDLTDTVVSLLETSDPELLQALLDWLQASERKAAFSRRIWPKLLAIAQDDRHATIVRLQALALGGEERPVLPKPLFEFVLEHLDAERPVPEQLAAVAALREGTVSPSQRRALIRRLPSLGPLTLQEVLTLFARVRSPSEQMALLDALAQNPSLAAVPAGRLRQLFTHPTAVAEKKLDALIAAVDPTPAAQRKRLEELLAQLPSGDRRRGYAVFFSQKAACSTCHSIGYLGGNIGPDLTKVGEIRTERDLLEAIVFPSASFVRSFEPVTVLTDDGRLINGMVRDDSPSQLVLVVSADQTETIPKASIEAIKPGKVSIMPAGLDRQLSLQELADLVTFLKQAR